MNAFDSLCHTVFHRNWPDISAEEFNRMPLLEQVSILNSLVFDVRSVCLRSGTDTGKVSVKVADLTAQWLFDGLLEEKEPEDLPKAPAPDEIPDRKIPFWIRLKFCWELLRHG